MDILSKSKYLVEVGIVIIANFNLINVKERIDGVVNNAISIRNLNYFIYIYIL